MFFASLQTRNENEETNYYTTNPNYQEKKNVFEEDSSQIDVKYRWLDDYGWI